ncbi:hypothetical protein B4N89_06350 [Embleya scabrispora]|uniref:Uncharacterized protein n=1 Tax=Embleya scabrispora TaxID=159449 RepID=A0A1T3NVE9_9ACTN|nr:hypothetical protein B4N89_06350 [Embleya scabrispora]
MAACGRPRLRAWPRPRARPGPARARSRARARARARSRARARARSRARVWAECGRRRAGGSAGVVAGVSLAGDVRHFWLTHRQITCGPAATPAPRSGKRRLSPFR